VSRGLGASCGRKTEKLGSSCKNPELLTQTSVRPSRQAAVIRNYNHEMPDEKEDPRIYFAAERTFLAWIRMGLALIAIGFAVARFGLFLREFRVSQVRMPLHGTGISLYAGVAFVVLGVAVNLSAATDHIRTVRELRSGTWIAGRISTNAVALAILLAIVGIGMGVYLLLLR
jgi:putative membrane protein